MFIDENKKTKKKNVIILFSIGLIFILISTINFIYRIPSLDSEIAFNEQDLNIRDRNHLLGTLYQMQEHNIYNQLKILSELKPNSTKLDELKTEALIVKRFELFFFYTDTYGKLPDEKIKNSWSNMNYSQLVDEQKKLDSVEGYVEKMEIIKKLKKDKTDIQFYSTIFQIFGLLITQVATILQIKWFEFPDKEINPGTRKK
jgi:hypothetical protein